jgi:hypothetical protein
MQMIQVSGHPPQIFRISNSQPYINHPNFHFSTANPPSKTTPFLHLSTRFSTTKTQIGNTQINPNTVTVYIKSPIPQLQTNQIPKSPPVFSLLNILTTQASIQTTISNPKPNPSQANPYQFRSYTPGVLQTNPHFITQIHYTQAHIGGILNHTLSTQTQPI